MSNKENKFYITTPIYYVNDPTSLFAFAQSFAGQDSNF